MLRGGYPLLRGGVPLLGGGVPPPLRWGVNFYLIDLQDVEFLGSSITIMHKNVNKA